MKRLVLFAVILVSALFFARKAVAQQQDATVHIASALQKSPDLLLPYMGAAVELTLPDVEDSYNSAEAIKQLSAFYEQNKPKSFVLKHKGSSPNGAKFIIGNLSTSQGVYRAYIAIKNNKIESISLEK